MEHIGQRIKELRVKNDLTQDRLADCLGVSAQAVSKWESAQSIPDMNRVLLLSKVFGVSTDYLLKDEMSEPPAAEGPLPEDSGKKLFSILSLVCSLLSMLTCCVPGLGLILGIGGIVFAIMALAKKQLKSMAIVGLVIGIISFVLSAGYLGFNLMFKMVAGTSIGDMFNQMLESQREGCTLLEDVVFLNPGQDEFYAFYSDGSYETADGDDGYYTCYSYMQYNSITSNSDELNEVVLSLMSSGYRIPELTVVDYGSHVEYYIVPEGWTPGSYIYYMEKNDHPSDDMIYDYYKPTSVRTYDINDFTD